MSDQLLLVLRVGLLALVYLTFFRVLRAVWVELRTESRVVVASPVVVPAAPAAPQAVAATGTATGAGDVHAEVVVPSDASAADRRAALLVTVCTINLLFQPSILYFFYCNLFDCLQKYRDQVVFRHIQ